MSDSAGDRTVEKLLRQQSALASFGGFAFREPDLATILTEAARICAACLDVPFCKICRYRAAEDDLLIEAGCGWRPGVVGLVVSHADESSPQGRAYVTGAPVIMRNLLQANDLSLPAFYRQHGIVSTVDVVIPAVGGTPYGVLEIDSPTEHRYDVHDINFLTGFANVLAEAVATATRVKALQALVEEKNLLAEELQHRVRNNLQMVSGMLESYARKTTDDEGHRGIDQIARRVTALAQIYDSLLGVGLSATIDLGDYLRDLCARLPELQNDRVHKVALACSVETLLLPVDKVSALGMVVAELVTNSYGHAFPDREGTIAVTLARAPGGCATLTIRDDGVGYTSDGESTRRGLHLVRRLIEQVNATIALRPAAGTSWIVTFAAPAASTRSTSSDSASMHDALTARPV